LFRYDLFFLRSFSVFVHVKQTVSLASNYFNFNTNFIDQKVSKSPLSQNVTGQVITATEVYSRLRGVSDSLETWIPIQIDYFR
jgi:hypothetical protein